jgi:23S rRNA (adenine-N6)-dimethyltransferase
VRSADLSPADLVLDIGAGNGALTSELARRAGRVWAIEIDPLLAARLRQRFHRAQNVSVTEADALRVRLPAEPFRVVANIPFNRTTAILRRLLDDPRVPLARADVIVAAAVASKRARMMPGTLLGIYWGAWYEFALTRCLDASAFSPPPSTDAAVLRIVRRADALVPHADAGRYRTLLARSFEARSPLGALRGTISGLERKRLARSLGFSPQARPWQLDQHQWAGIFHFVRSRR